MKINNKIRAMAFVNNSISADILQKALKIDKIYPSECYVVMLRASAELPSDFTRQVSQPVKVGGLNNYICMLKFYRQQILLIKKLMTEGLEEIYIVNIDNIICANSLILAKNSNNKTRVSVVAEGFMNYQDITAKNRSTLNIGLKKIMAYIIGAHYPSPKGHLSGSYSDGVRRVFSYPGYGLKSPQEKIKHVALPVVKIEVEVCESEALIVLTGIYQWMSKEDFAEFSLGFQSWINSQNYTKVYYKPHPNYDSGGIEDGVVNKTKWMEVGSVEKLAGKIPVRTVIGFCTTALATLKQIRPDLRVIDWGSNFYVRAAYKGDRSVVEVLERAGVEIVPD